MSKYILVNGGRVLRKCFVLNTQQSNSSVMFLIYSNLLKVCCKALLLDV